MKLFYRLFVILLFVFASACQGTLLENPLTAGSPLTTMDEDTQPPALATAYAAATALHAEAAVQIPSTFAAFAEAMTQPAKAATAYPTLDWSLTCAVFAEAMVQPA